jgi:hypothetical protein
VIFVIYQIFYDATSRAGVRPCPAVIVPFGVHRARELPPEEGFLYDGTLSPHLAQHNTLCEWRVLYYVWKHHRSDWVGFTSWRHDEKKFEPLLASITRNWVEETLARRPIHGFAAQRPIDLLPPPFRDARGVTLLQHYSYFYEKGLRRPGGSRDVRGSPFGCYHHPRYLEFVFQEFERRYGVALEGKLDWVKLGQARSLHTWCNAFVARWDYFDDYMTVFTPVVEALMEHFGSHPTDLELCYVCERLIILYNYIQASGLKIKRST